MRLSAVLVLSALLAAAAVAQTVGPPPVSRAGDRLALQALGHRFLIPLPDWREAAEHETLEEVEALFASDARQALLEIVPKGQDLADWQTLYAARITLEPERALDDYRRAVMFGYAQSCQASLTGFFQFGEDQGEVLAPLGFVCGAFLDRLEGFAGRGQVAIMSFKRTPNGIALVSQEWRGNAFDPTNPGTWPVPTTTVEIRARQLQDEAVLELAGN